MSAFIFLLFIIFSSLIGAHASKRGRSGFGWFILSILISPILSLLILLIAGEKQTA